MNRFRAAAIGILMVLAALSPAAPAGAAPHYLALVNDSADTVTQLAVRAHGSPDWTAFDVGPDRTSSVLRGGQTTTLALRSGCVYDVRATFQNGRTLTVVDFDACKAATLHLEQAVRKARASGVSGG